MTLRNRLLGTLAAAAASMLLTTGTMGSAAAADPLPPAPFTYCPMHYTAQPLRFCFVSVGTGGTFKMGKVTVNLTPNTILQGGFVQDPVTYKVSFIDAEPASKTLDSPGQAVPGGLLGVAQIQDLIPGITNVSAEVHLVGLPTSNLRNLFYGVTPGITLPVIVKLVNTLLGPDCTIGTPAAPILLNLTSGTTSPPAPALPMKGTLGQAQGLGPGGLLVKGASVVDNTWSAPGATGCGALGLLNSAVNLQSGLPSAAGVNEVRLNNNVYLMDPVQVFNNAPYPGY
jgi:hypothetical protein